ncbi:hypothetical protein BD414DRAFT_480405 [Trametes punicea]|nr:hypothetical protein BD414DRAFT_480405 [Trametes punicea]
MTSTAWADPYYLHPWFRMPSLKRKELSSDEEDAPTTPLRAASVESRRSLSPAPAPSPKRRRCDVLESGMSQLTLDGRPIPSSSASFIPGQFASRPPPPSPPPLDASTAAATAAVYPPIAPTVHFPDTATTASQSAAPLWADGPHAPNVTHLPNANGTATVIRPESVEEPTSPETIAEEVPEVPEVSMKVPSWYEIEKDRIVITDLEGSDSEEDEDDDRGKSQPAAPAVIEDADADAPQFTISSVLLDRLPKPGTPFGPLAPKSNSSNALVLYRPLPLPREPRSDADEDKENRDVRTPTVEEEDAPRIEEVVETEDVPIAEDEVPMDDLIEFTPILESVSEPQDEPMDIEML